MFFFKQPTDIKNAQFIFADSDSGRAIDNRHEKDNISNSTH